ncbi:hypothetical protein OMW55_08390 [Sphingomonas sp. BN140010]|uniref:Uncharacterized protein n=1 Tax=Sphingomonas arvum TaxID=2992113 RepID=A0ABT3JFH0_9SPHN|nr:hypothetical protein [Sphingomonas sp. BN140010]MCW3797820.1 hypothetical protein [Sphingomonas sp. BN140010]
MSNAVFIQANPRQMLGARISAYSFRRNSAAPDSFTVHIMDVRDHPKLMLPGQTILRGGHVRAWDPDDLQSFTPLRFYPPQAMGFEGRAVVTDPDVFAASDVAELFARELDGKPVWAVPRPGHNGRADYVATSVMLLDCARLTHWQFDRDLDDLFAHRIDYVEWIELRREDPANIGHLEPEWNSFDKLTSATRLLHTTKRRTQPWKTGLPVDYTLREKGGLMDLLRPFRARRYQRHPDSNQEALVYSLLAEMIDAGEVSRAELEAEMAANHVRHDSLQMVDRWRGWEMQAAA